MNAQDFVGIVQANMLSPVLAALGGPNSWQYYLLQRFMQEVVLVILLVMGAYWILVSMAQQGVQHLEEVAARRPAKAGPDDGAAAGEGPAGSRGELLRLVPLALTGGPTRLFLQLVLAVNVVRNCAVILDDFIIKFDPKLPTDWLDDVVRIMSQCLTPLDSFLTKASLVGTTLLACAVALRWKDVMVAYVVRTHVEPLDKGPELVTSFINPASNLINWLLVMGTAVWLALHLGFNLQPLLAVGGASGIVIGLATQQVLGNFVSGLNIFLARPFVSGEYISIIGPNLVASQVSGKVVRIDPMRTLVATEDSATIAVPNKLIAECVVINRSRSPHWSVGSASMLLAHTRELRFRVKLPHTAVDKLEELEQQLGDAVSEALPEALVRHAGVHMEVVRFTDTGAELSAKCALAWRMRTPKDPPRPQRTGAPGAGAGSGPAAGAGGPPPTTARVAHERQEAQEELLQRALLRLNAVVRAAGGTFIAG